MPAAGPAGLMAQLPTAAYAASSDAIDSVRRSSSASSNDFALNAARIHMINRLTFRAAALCLVALLAACSTTPPPAPPVKTVSAPHFETASFAEMPAIEAADWLAGFNAFRTSCTALRSKPAWQSVCAKADETPSELAQAFFESNFTPWRVSVGQFEGETLVAKKETGLATGYYEPLLQGSRERVPPYIYPIYGVPDDLLIIDLADLYPSLKGLRLRGKLEGRRVVPYDTRGEIQKRSDMSRWAIAWVDDPVAAFFLQIQGSGRIALPDGSFMRVGFADQNGYKYRSIGNWLVQHEGLKPHELSMQNIRAWAKKNPAKVREALAQNPSFVFFEERRGHPELGPVGAQGVHLTPLASVAVDPKHWQLGTPFILEVHQSRPALDFVRPVVAQDTGGAIKGLIRVDYFWGFGDEAGREAGRQRSDASLWMLVPNGLLPDDVRPARTSR